MCGCLATTRHNDGEAAHTTACVPPLSYRQGDNPPVFFFLINPPKKGNFIENKFDFRLQISYTICQQGAGHNADRRHQNKGS